MRVEAQHLRVGAASSRLPPCFPEKEPLIRPSRTSSPHFVGRREKEGGPIAYFLRNSHTRTALDKLRGPRSASMAPIRLARLVRVLGGGPLQGVPEFGLKRQAGAVAGDRYRALDRRERWRAGAAGAGHGSGIVLGAAAAVAVELALFLLAACLLLGALRLGAAEAGAVSAAACSCARAACVCGSGSD